MHQFSKILLLAFRKRKTFIQGINSKLKGNKTELKKKLQVFSFGKDIVKLDLDYLDNYLITYGKMQIDSKANKFKLNINSELNDIIR